MNTDHVQAVYPMWEGYRCHKCEERVKGRKVWKCDLLQETVGGRHKETKYICAECAPTEEDAVEYFIGETKCLR